MRRIINPTGIVAAVLLAFSFSASAERTVEEVYKQCGLGGAFFGESSPTMAFISNVTWDLGTTAASSDSSDACAISNEETAAIYIHEAYEMLERDISKGRGEYFDNLATILSCESESVGRVMSAVRAEFSGVVASEAYASMSKMEKSNALYKIVSPRLAAQKSTACTLS